MKKSLGTTVEAFTEEALPIRSLRLLAPPLRLVSAAMWKVMKERDVTYYGKMVEFVSSVAETVPGLLSYRHQAKLMVGLQARMILGMLQDSDPPDSRMILSHLDRFNALFLSASTKPGKDVKVRRAVKDFHGHVQILLRDRTKRKAFFQGEFQKHFGPQYDAALEKLLWEFLTRLDQLLPVPDLAQTVSWLSAAPSVLEECARSASQPQLLRTLLKHERCLGHLDSAPSIPSSTGDSIISSLSLPPSGRVRQIGQSGSSPAFDGDPSPPSSSLKPNCRETRSTPSPITPVMGLIPCQDLPHRASANEKAASILKNGRQEVSVTDFYTKVKWRGKEDSFGKVPANKVKRSLGGCEAEKEDVMVIRKVRAFSDKDPRSRQSQRGREKGAEGNERREREADGEERSTKVFPDSVANLKPQEMESQYVLINSCLKRQLKVLLPRLDVRHVSLPMSSFVSPTEVKDQTVRSPLKPDWGEMSNQRNGSAVTRKRKLSSTLVTPDKNPSALFEKENHTASPCIPLTVPPWRQSPAPSPGELSDLILDSEDEDVSPATKKKMFRNRYHKTKTNTYIPTLAEFGAPNVIHRDLVSPGNSHC